MEYLLPQSMKAIEALKTLYPDSSRRTIQNWIKGGRFTVDHEPISREDHPLLEGQTLRSRLVPASKKVEGVNILFEDRYLLAIDKPAMLLSVPLDEPVSPRSALSILKEHCRTDQVFAVHRIDRETSGVLLFAKGMESRDKFKDMFERHDLEREYFAIVEGRLPQDKGSWQCSLKELSNYDVEVAQNEGEGKLAITHFEVLRRSAKYTYLRLMLETGRKHQIRVHCKQAGFPVLGDKRYGSLENPIKRLCLHAKSISFSHPFTTRRHTFASPLPPAFKKLVPDTLFSPAQ